MLILFVDDEDLLGDLVEAHIQHEYPGCQLEQATTCEESLTMLKAKQYELVLMDYHLFGTSGLECLREIRAQYPDLPVVMITGDDRHRIGSEAMAAGADDFVEKVDLNSRLAATVWSAIERRKHRRQVEAETQQCIRSLDFLRLS